MTAPSVAAVWLLCLLAPLLMGTSGELVQDGGFESLTGWSCPGCTCTLSDTARRSGQYGVAVTGRSQAWMGPSQHITISCGQPSYQASAYIKLLNDQGPQPLQIMVDFKLTDGSHKYSRVVRRTGVKVSDGWLQLVGSIQLPVEPLDTVRVYFSGPAAGVDFAVDDASVIAETCQCDVPLTSDQVIEQIRKSDIHFDVTVGAAINRSDVEIHVRQLKKSFPFGTAVNAIKYNDNAGGGKYRDIIHNHFNWAVLANALKWRQLEWRRGTRTFQRALDAVNSLRSHGLKVRGHTLVWSEPDRIPNWVKELSGQELRDAVSFHIRDAMNVTKGLLEHWDVNNENLHAQWFEDRLQDPDYTLELFRLAHHADPSVKLFLNDYNVVSQSYFTDAYLQQAKKVSSAYVGLYAIGAQCHFGLEQEPDPVLIKQRLDTLAQAGLPIWATELDVQAQDENRRADFYEKALRALYGHPAVEGILIWGFWDQSHWRGEKAALVVGDNLQITEAGRRVLDLMENQWMTNTSRILSQSGDQFTVRGFHGDYEVMVYNKGTELQRSIFTLGKTPESLSLNVQ